MRVLKSSYFKQCSFCVFYISPKKIRNKDKIKMRMSQFWGRGFTSNDFKRKTKDFSDTALWPEVSNPDVYFYSLRHASKLPVECFPFSSFLLSDLAGDMGGNGDNVC